MIIPFANRNLSAFLYFTQTKAEYEQTYFNLIGIELLAHSCKDLCFAYLLRLCKWTKLALITNTVFCLLDLISTLFNTGDIINDTFSFSISVICMLIIIAELLTTKITRK